MVNTLFILNDPPYGTERCYNGVRLASALSKRDDEDVKIFLVGDATACAKAGQRAPQGHHSIESMLKAPARRGAEIGVCGSCMDARGIEEPELVEGTKRSTLEELADWTQWADRTLVF